MKLKGLLFVLLLNTYVGKMYSQIYQVTFSGKGVSNTITSITVENLTKGLSITLGGSDTLTLMSGNSINNEILKNNRGLTVTPNAGNGEYTVSFMNHVAGTTILSLFNLKGQLISQWDKNLPEGCQSFNIKGLKNGLYILKVSTGKGKYSSKLAGFDNTGEKISIESLSSQNRQKSSKITTLLAYDDGDILLATGKYESFTKTFITKIPLDPRITIAYIIDFMECTDGDGNQYPVVGIGSKFWMAKNLRTTSLNDQTPIATDSSLASLRPACRSYKRTKVVDTLNTYGRLYNWYAVNTNKLCPVGWHVPTKEEWTALVESLGGSSVAGGYLKERGTYHWNSPNQGAKDIYGFTALPGGCVDISENYTYMGKYGFFWSSSEVNSNSASLWTMEYNYSNFIQDPSNKTSGYSVRCVSDL